MKDLKVPLIVLAITVISAVVLAIVLTGCAALQHLANDPNAIAAGQGFANSFDANKPQLTPESVQAGGAAVGAIGTAVGNVALTAIGAAIYAFGTAMGRRKEQPKSK